MNQFAKFAVVCGLMVTALSARAESMDGYVALSGGMIRHMSTNDKVNNKDLRYGGRIDFVRLQKNIALDLRYGTGLDYVDYGAAFKLFHHFGFASTNATGLSMGVGFGGNYSSGFEGQDVAFSEMFVPAFARILLDFGMGLGFVIEGEYNAVLSRQAVSGPDFPSGTLNRYYIGAGLAISAM